VFATANNAANAYQKVGLETSVRNSNPHQLVVLLLAGARQAILLARGGIEQKNVPLKGSSITHAIDIILNGLRASLDQEKGGQIAANLSGLYDYMARRLLRANLDNDIAALDEVLRLLTEIQEAWEAIADKGVAGGTTTAATTVVANGR
jgi:flagellar protein FliS